jgi:hypothetical protein
MKSRRIGGAGTVAGICGLAIALVLAAPAAAQPTPAQNAAAFAASAAITNQSYHWDSISGGVPQVATTPRTTLPGTTLTTITWNPAEPSFYQVKTIDSVDVQCTLVATFTRPFATWTAPPGTVTTLSRTGTDSLTHYSMPFVTTGDTLRDYLRGTYFTGTSVPAPLETQHRIQQALGLPTTADSDRGLAFFWAPIANIARPAYSADITSQFPTLPTYGDGSYQAVTAGAPAGFSYLDFNDDTKTYSTLPEYVQWNQAQTFYPWSAMGYTYNWNSLQTSSTNVTLGYDPLAPSSPFGLSEFIVSAGSKIVNAGFVTNAELGIWAVPEPATWVIVIVGITGLGAAVRRRTVAGRPATPPSSGRES